MLWAIRTRVEIWRKVWAHDRPDTGTKEDEKRGRGLSREDEAER
jgi:hypothetical protein